jgi:methylated-DNA-protein-cysteine methyltransferase related protein
MPKLKSTNQNLNYFEKVYQVVSGIPAGSVATYGQIAEALGTRDARRVGHALHANRDPQNIPCHRVVKKDGSLAPGYAFGGPNEQKNVLKSEGVTFKGGSLVNMERHLFKI